MTRLAIIAISLAGACSASEAISPRFEADRASQCQGEAKPATFTFHWSNGNPGILMYNRWTEPERQADTVAGKVYLFVPCMSFMDSLALHDPEVILHRD